MKKIIKCEKVPLSVNVCRMAWVGVIYYGKCNYQLYLPTALDIVIRES